VNTYRVSSPLVGDVLMQAFCIDTARAKAQYRFGEGAVVDPCEVAAFCRRCDCSPCCCHRIAEHREATRLKPGTLCPCDNCVSERAGRETVYRSEKFCRGCGHGYIRVGQADNHGGCQKCGLFGQFSDTKPAASELVRLTPKQERANRAKYNTSTEMPSIGGLVARVEAKVRSGGFDKPEERAK
jgi:hypothetical protein